MIFEFLTAFTLIGTGVKLANGQWLTAIAYLFIGILSFNQCMMLSKQLDTIPFYIKWIK